MFLRRSAWGASLKRDNGPSQLHSLKRYVQSRVPLGRPYTRIPIAWYGMSPATMPLPFLSWLIGYPTSTWQFLPATTTSRDRRPIETNCEFDPLSSKGAKRNVCIEFSRQPNLAIRIRSWLNYPLDQRSSMTTSNAITLLRAVCLQATVRLRESRKYHQVGRIENAIAD